MDDPSSVAGDRLVVFIGGEERAGVIAYGVGPRGGRTPATPPVAIWPTAGAIQPLTLRGEAWEVVAWEIAFRAWPDASQWRKGVRATLRAHLDAGSRVAWIGAEGVPFCDPPLLFCPSCMAGGVLAWMTDSEFQCHVDPAQPWRAADDVELTRLRRYAAGLADAD